MVLLYRRKGGGRVEGPGSAQAIVFFNQSVHYQRFYCIEERGMEGGREGGRGMRGGGGEVKGVHWENCGCVDYP